jgi:glycerol-3-phosphate acyltransferase PlsY
MKVIFFWLLFSYLFGSIPTAFLVTKWILGKDIRKIGRKKASGSNVIHNVGFLPGILVGVFDIFKGVLAVGGAYFLGLNPFWQALCGILAVCGQMWPIFLKFWGGRGGGTSIGAMLGLNPLLAIFAVGIWILTKLISREMGAPIGMVNFYLICGGVGLYFGWQEVYIFSFVTLFLIFVQRGLGKPGSFSKIKDKKILLWRLLLDRDTKERMKSEKAMW